jgi:16S rRNA (guanine527-N7)-methyltransferase
VFGERLGEAQEYARWLATDAVERGLIGPREVERLWDRHLLNSAAVASEVPHGAAVLDAGSGAGLPGIPLALVRPDLSVTLVEPLLRRATALTEVCGALSRSGLDVRRARIEELPRASTEVIVARAVAPLGRLVTWTLPRLVDGGRLVAMKGRTADEEVAEAEATLRRLGARSWEVRDLVLPTGRTATRAVVVIAGDGRGQR